MWENWERVVPSEDSLLEASSPFPAVSNSWDQPLLAALHHTRLLTPGTIQWQPPLCSCPVDPCISGTLPCTTSWTCGPISLILRSPASASHLILAQHLLSHTWHLGLSLVFLIQDSGYISSVLHTHSGRAPTPSPAPRQSSRPTGKVTLRESPHRSVVSGSSLVIWEKLFTLWKFKVYSN